MKTKILIIAVSGALGLGACATDKNGNSNIFRRLATGAIYMTADPACYCWDIRGHLFTCETANGNSEIDYCSNHRPKQFDYWFTLLQKISKYDFSAYTNDPREEGWFYHRWQMGDSPSAAITNTKRLDRQTECDKEGCWRPDGDAGFVQVGSKSHKPTYPKAF